jgi:hypothetical protein
MIYGALLGIHLFGAALTGLAIVYALIVMARGQTTHYRNVALFLGGLSAFEIATGTTLAILSSQVTAVSLCHNIALYLTACFVTEALLYVRVQQSKGIFPTLMSATPTLATLCFFMAAISFGF